MKFIPNITNKHAQRYFCQEATVASVCSHGEKLPQQDGLPGVVQRWPASRSCPGQRRPHVNSDRRQAVHRGKIDPGVDELPRDHVNRPKVVFALHQLVKRNVAKCILNRAPVRTGNASSGTIFVLEQDSSAALLKVEHDVSDRFLKRSGPSLNTFVGVKITTALLIGGEFEATTTGSRFDSNTTQRSLFSLLSFLERVGWRAC